MKSELQDCIDRLLEVFPNSFVNHKKEFIAHKYSNQYIILSNCDTPLDIECKVLEWFSRSTHKGIPYHQDWRNKRFRELMSNCINDFLETDFTAEDFDIIYTKLGNAINHELTIKFIQSGYDMKILMED